MLKKHRFLTMTMNNAVGLNSISSAHTPFETECGAMGAENHSANQAVPTERMLRFLKGNNPYQFQVDGTAVTISFSGEKPFQDVLVNALNAS